MVKERTNVRVETGATISILEGGKDSVVKEGIESLAYVHRHESMNLVP